MYIDVVGQIHKEGHTCLSTCIWRT